MIRVTRPRGGGRKLCPPCSAVSIQASPERFSRFSERLGTGDLRKAGLRARKKGLGMMGDQA